MKIGFNPNFAPFSYLKDGKPSGIVIERIVGIFEKSGIKYELVPAELTGLTSGLMQGEFDILAALAKTPEREKTLSFSNPIIVSGAAWFKASNSVPLMDGELPKMAVTPKVGPLVGQIKALFPEIELLTSENYDTSLQDVLDGKADAAALNWHVGKMLVREKYNLLFHVPLAPFNTMALHMATKLPDKNNLIIRLNEHIPDDWGPDPL
ncbi:MAG: transporter substrate-binding domain-containing protein [Kordiimonadaceae bacterium]|nr:transporter substrate-binding domain-containing protein [Kordiimonadaceae bacterium]MBT6035025.1 transporter substrate-binding domain-containing protein [Kordiimonadaceae bacterium]